MHSPPAAKVSTRLLVTGSSLQGCIHTIEQMIQLCCDSANLWRSASQQGLKQGKDMHKMLSSYMQPKSSAAVTYLEYHALGFYLRGALRWVSIVVPIPAA